MTPRPPAVGPLVPDAGRHAAPPRRGIATAVVVAMLGIGAGTWFLGSGEDPAAPEDASATVAVVPEERVQELPPALSVAPAPSEEAYAAARRASRTKGGAPLDAPVKKKAAKAKSADAASTDTTDLVASG